MHDVKVKFSPKSVLSLHVCMTFFRSGYSSFAFVRPEKASYITDVVNQMLLLCLWIYRGNHIETVGVRAPTRTLPVGTRTCNPHGFTLQNGPRNREFGSEMGEIHSISMFFTKLNVSHSFLDKKTRSWGRLKARGYEHAYPYPTREYPYPRPVRVRPTRAIPNLSARKIFKKPSRRSSRCCVSKACYSVYAPRQQYQKSIFSHAKQV
ncbi:hypothetical protein GALMADRAFT_245981 [Galerina marginata CBS 339.88]|uniref:Uncharacterized protein n=1 Tax=Galerina marginata (strain CBS 339.88) TaxID=685588 RepID=A0A067T3H7_GALM3|nr:hypothetical protein GALMADRAFT_245981 [Galerina marginata CBS 339.88]